ncbi:MAG: endonuclease [Pseudomonadota bacterium]
MMAKRRPAGPRRWTLAEVYARLFAAFGPQHWWPAQSPFEVMVGAILTQNTAWQNVERAIANLRARDRLDAARISATRRDHLAAWLRPSGYFNIKAARLHNFCRWYLDSGGYAALARHDTAALRAALLGVNGIGPETADDILLYAFTRPVFVIDAYTRRLLARLGLYRGDEPYEDLRLAIETVLGPDTDLYGEYHALIVRHAKQHCRVRPLCAGCVLRGACPAALPAS